MAHYFAVLANVEIANIYKPLIAFFAMTAIALLWRALLIKLLMGYIHLETHDSGEKTRLNDRIEKLEEWLEKLEIISHPISLILDIIRESNSPATEVAESDTE